MQGSRSLWSPLLMTLALLCDNRGPSVVCQQNFRTALTLKYLCRLFIWTYVDYLYGLSSFKLALFHTIFKIKAVHGFATVLHRTLLHNVSLCSHSLLFFISSIDPSSMVPWSNCIVISVQFRNLGRDVS